MTELSEKYRLKALVCEERARDATDLDLKLGWEELAIEWHALANRAMQLQ